MAITAQTITAHAAAAQPPRHGFCVENQSPSPRVFVVDAGAQFRDVATLAPGERLCTPEFPTPTDGFISTFYDENAIEGCSRLTKAGTVQILRAYHDFDRCQWQEHP